MKTKRRPAPVKRLDSKVTRTNAADRKLMAALREIIEGERSQGDAGLIVRKIEVPDRERKN